MPSYSAISIICNPKSTRPSNKKAHDLVKQLRRTDFKGHVRIIATTHAGHAETLAYKLAHASTRPLIISASGDGGYNEIVNGVIRAQAEGATPVTGLLRAGNANDHYDYLHKGNMSERIMKGSIRKIDLLQIGIGPTNANVRYAHSYIGIGLTPAIGHELNQFRLNPFNEKWIVLKSLYKLKPVTLRIRGRIKVYDSVVFANIGRMSKILSLSNTASVADGKFELVTFKHQTRSKLLIQLFQAATKGLKTTNRRKAYAFKTVESINIQLDGEITTIPANTEVQIAIVPKALACIV